MESALSRLKLFFLLLLLLLMAACDRTPQLRPLAGNAVVLAFGDSLTRGNGAPAGNAYPEVLAGLLDRTVINAGRITSYNVCYTKLLRADAR